MSDKRHSALLGVIAAIAVLFTSARPAPAQPSGAELVTRGVSEYEDLEYEKAIASLRAARASTKLTENLRIRALSYEALSLLALGRKAEARTAFGALLRLNRTFTLPRTESRAARLLLEEVRRSLPEPKPKVIITHIVAPAATRAGNAFNVGITLSDPGRAHRSVVVRHRAGGSGSFSSVHAASTKHDQYQATIPGLQVQAGELWLEVVVMGAGGVVLTRSEHRRVTVTAAQASPVPAAGTPIYKRWWFWTAIGASVAAGTSAFLLTRSDGGSERAAVTISFDFGQR